MAYVPGNLNLISVAPLTGAGQHWSLSGTDAATDVDAAGFISDGGDRGMRVGDLVYYRDTDDQITTTHVVLTVSSTAPGAVNLNLGTTVGSSTTGD
jgi:hypothetical protein